MTEQNVHAVQPRFDVLESDDNFLLRADVPGVASDGIDIQLEKGMLTFTGTRKLGDDTVEYRRRFRIPEAIDPEKDEAKLNTGVLEIQLAKREAAKPRRIAVKTG